MCLFFIKFWMFLAGSIHLVIGTLVIILGVIIQSTDSSLYPNSLDSSIGIISWIVIGVGSFIFLSGIMGIVGGMKKLSFCIFIFLCVSVVFFLITLVLAIASSVGRSKLEEEIGTSQACIEHFSDINSPFEEGYAYWCTNTCPCYMTNAIYNSYSQNDQNSIVRQAENTPEADRNYNLLQCQNEIQQVTNDVDFTSLDENSDFLQSIEEYFECAGFCDSKNVYAFSSSNNGTPADYPNNVGCYEGIYDKLDGLLKELILPLWIISSVFCLNIVLGYVLMCSPQRKEYYNNAKQNGAESAYYS
ncbi:hypothetical protein PPERSA_12048 [Pseudocohnilembus persalinus]|uniref:Tetraspanin/Peripherin n=1 Tax=Pseudocohnilembus persalinus TaxID=266149 RepID=A0A0V0R8U0_PSEPJ|nr:hypothetical protein PPERSA_12048 [Pseudocohnilembus persalinus]|eukprot:KRX10924.1 hypothetical protein PPERSA_12048 [Pseudocohnilembus persalinus]